LETTKLTVSTIEPTLEADASSEVLGRLNQTYSAYVPTWVDNTSTPQVVKQVIAMYYASWIYDRAFSEVETAEARISYGAVLRIWATTLLTDIIRGAVDIAELDAIGGGPSTGVIYYPTDASSTWDAWRTNTDCDDNSLGPAKFGMGKVFLWLLRRSAVVSESTK
jgi:hypothetical protein